MTFGISNSKSIWFVIWLALLTVPLEAEVIFQETFPGGERDKQSPPASLAWYATVPDSVKIEQGAMVLSGANASQRAVSASFPAVTLKVGEKLKLDFDMVLGGEIGYSNGALRIGLYSADNAPAADGENPGTGAAGYLVALSHGQHTGNKAAYTGSSFFERLSSSKGIKITSYQNHISVGHSGTRPGAYEAGTPYSVEFTIERTSANAVNLDFKISGGGFTDKNDCNASTEGTQGEVFSEFNTLVLLINAVPGGFPQVAFSNLKLEVVRAH